MSGMLEREEVLGSSYDVNDAMRERPEVEAVEAWRASAGAEGNVFRCVECGGEKSAVWCAEFAALERTEDDVRREEKAGGRPSAPAPLKEYDAAEPVSGRGGGGAKCEEAEAELALACTEKRCETRGVVAIFTEVEIGNRRRENDSVDGLWSDLMLLYV